MQCNAQQLYNKVHYGVAFSTMTSTKKGETLIFLKLFALCEYLDSHTYTSLAAYSCIDDKRGNIGDSLKAMTFCHMTVWKFQK